MTLAELVVKIGADTTAFNSAMAGAKKTLDSIGQSATKAGTFLTAGLTPRRAAVGASSIKAFSDLNESVNKAQVAFGRSSKAVSDFAATSARSYGISKRNANEYSATLGVILQTSGLAQDATAGMSVELVKLAADLASFNNIPIDEALEKGRSGLGGEAEPLRTVGVLLSEA